MLPEKLRYKLASDHR